jgi:hypothetical protein
VIIPHWRQPIGLILKGQESKKKEVCNRNYWALKLGPIGGPETLVIATTHFVIAQKSAVLPLLICVRQKLYLGHAVTQLVEALPYKPEGRGFDSRWCHCDFSFTLSFRPHYGPGVDSASNRNEYHEYFLGGKGGRSVGLINLPHAGADCLERWEPKHPGTLRACPGL